MNYNPELLYRITAEIEGFKTYHSDWSEYDEDDFYDMVEYVDRFTHGMGVGSFQLVIKNKSITYIPSAMLARTILSIDSVGINND